MTMAGFWVRVSATGLLLFAAVLGAVFLTGSTFGQRCAVSFEWGSPAWEGCVAALAGREESP
jgi:hypothetical protein